MEPIEQIIIYLLIGLFAGCMSGMFGIGGGSIRTPLLYVAGLPLLSSFGINLLVIPLSSFIAAISHRKNIDLKIAQPVIIGGILGTVTGAFLIGFISTFVLAIIFVIVSIITVFGIYFDRIFPEIAQKINPSMMCIISGAIGLSIVKLEKIENGVLYVSGVDAFDGTPVLDIKPYLPSINCVKSVQNELIEKELGHHDEIFINDSTFYK